MIFVVTPTLFSKNSNFLILPLLVPDLISLPSLRKSTGLSFWFLGVGSLDDSTLF